MNITESFKNKTFVITGGTGSFGSTVLKHFLTTDIGGNRLFRQITAANHNFTDEFLEKLMPWSEQAQENC